MDRGRRERLVRILDTIGDQFPRALVQHPKGLSLKEATGDADWLRGRDRFVLPRADALDHWEAARLGDPWAYVDLGPGGPAMGLQVEGPEGLEALGRVLEPEHEGRLEAFLEAAGRQDEEAESAAVRTRLGADGRFREDVVNGRAVPTSALGRVVLEALVDTARVAMDRAGGAGGAATTGAGVRLARVPLREEDDVALRRTAKRLVALWRPLWGVPVPRPRMKKPELDARLDAAYRRSLRLIAGRMGPAERAALRVEVRAIEDAYREAGLQRPRLLDILSDRLGLL